MGWRWDHTSNRNSQHERGPVELPVIKYNTCNMNELKDRFELCQYPKSYSIALVTLNLFYYCFDIIWCIRLANSDVTIQTCAL